MMGTKRTPQVKRQLAKAALLLLAFGLTSEGGAASSTQFVVLEATKGMDEHGMIEEVYPAEVVTVLKFEGTRLFVQRTKNQASLYNFPESEWKVRLRPVWLPRSILASPSEFVRVTKWRADETLDFSDGPDAGGQFVIVRSGAFVYSDHQGNALDAPPAQSWRGHLFRRGNVLWARPANTASFSGRYRLLHVVEGQLCMPGVGCLRSSAQRFDLGIK
jgi:hypothetical protein